MIEQLLQECLENERLRIRAKYSHIPYHVLEEYFVGEIDAHLSVLDTINGELMAYHNFHFNIKDESLMNAMLERVEVIKRESDIVINYILELAGEAFILGCLDADDLTALMDELM